MKSEPYKLTEEEKEKIKRDVARSLQVGPQERYEFFKALRKYAIAGQVALQEKRK